jgi:lysophospholipase L1-like esterase
MRRPPRPVRTTPRVLARAVIGTLGTFAAVGAGAQPVPPPSASAPANAPAPAPADPLQSACLTPAASQDARQEASPAPAAPAAPRDALPAVFYVGDSTVRNGSGTGANGEWGWADQIAPYFDPRRVHVVNCALGGRSSRTYLTQGHWERVRALLRPGDVVVVQFGHNDGGPLNDTTRARGTIRGVGEETEAIANLLTRQPEVVHSYGWYLRRYVADARARGATPVIASPVPRNRWERGAVVRDRAAYAGWAGQVARAEGVPFLDLDELIARAYDAMGPDSVRALFGRDHAHTSLPGARLAARVVVAALKGLPRDPVAAYLSPAAAAVPAATTSAPPPSH